MTVLKELEDFSNGKDNASVLVLSFLLLISPMFIFLVIYFPALLLELDVIKLLVLAVVAGLITILPSTVAILIAILSNSIGVSVSDEQRTLFIVAFASIFTVPLECILLVISYFIGLPLEIFLIVYFSLTLACPLLIVLALLGNHRRSASGKR